MILELKKYNNARLWYVLYVIFTVFFLIWVIISISEKQHIIKLLKVYFITCLAIEIFRQLIPREIIVNKESIALVYPYLTKWKSCKIDYKDITQVRFNTTVYGSVRISTQKEIKYRTQMFLLYGFKEKDIMEISGILKGKKINVRMSP